MIQAQREPLVYETLQSLTFVVQNGQSIKTGTQDEEKQLNMCWTQIT